MAVLQLPEKSRVHKLASNRWVAPFAALAWLAILAGIFLEAQVGESTPPGDDIVRNTVRLALLYYALAASLMLTSRRDACPADDPPCRLARLCWTLGLAAYLVHVAAAFHYVHHWSHADAVRHTRAVSGVGEGLYVSYFFTLAWIADAFAWWLRPGVYARRPRWVRWALHAFMAFMIFNGTVIFETGWIRWAGAALFVALGTLWLGRALEFWKSRPEFSVCVPAEATVNSEVVSVDPPPRKVP